MPRLGKKSKVEVYNFVCKMSSQANTVESIEMQSFFFYLSCLFIKSASVSFKNIIDTILSLKDTNSSICTFLVVFDNVDNSVHLK
jgi:hypothetical protein